MDFYAVGQKLCTTRMEAGLTQGQLAKLVGLNRSSISRVENGMYGHFSIRKYAQICNALGLTLAVVSLPPMPTLEEAMAEAAEWRAKNREPVRTTDKITWYRVAVRLDKQELQAVLANGAKVSKIIRDIADGKP